MHPSTKLQACHTVTAANSTQWVNILESLQMSVTRAICKPQEQKRTKCKSLIQQKMSMSKTFSYTYMYNNQII